VAEEGAYALPLAHFAKDYLKPRLAAQPALAEYAPQTMDFRSILARLHASGCVSLMLVTPPARQGIILKQLAELRWDPLKLGLDASEDAAVLETAGESSDGLVYAKYTTGTPEFQERFKARFGREAGVPAALAYDAVTILAAAMNRSGTRASKVAAYLDGIRDFHGASGAISFVDGTRAERPVTLWTIKKGRPQELTGRGESSPPPAAPYERIQGQ